MAVLPPVRTLMYQTFAGAILFQNTFRLKLVLINCSSARKTVEDNLRPMSTTETVTQLLLAWSDGDAAALDRLLPYVETELRRLASYHMRHESVGHTLQTTALVNELYLKLVDQRQAKWQNRAHFFAVAAQLMRRILVDHARRQLRSKRGGGVSNLTLDEAIIMSPEKSGDVLSLNEALDRLAKLDPLKARIVELRHFGGLSVEETAEVLKISEVTVMRHWSLAKSWLRREVRG
jgi:RNA polymerase sigma-70 factor, ECF subfamily